jgi:SAM-dependent methyltransferase
VGFASPGSLRANPSGADISYNQVITPALQKLLRQIDTSNVLDVGCGTGIFTARLSESADKVTGIDPSRKSIEIARTLRLNQTTFIQSTAEDYSSEYKSTFTAIVANMVLMDVLNLDAFLDACRRMLVDKGALAFSITHPCFWPEYYGYSNENWFDYGTETIIESPFRISADRRGSLISTHIHRPLSAYVNGFARRGLAIKAIIEPAPPEDVDEAYRAAWKHPRYIVGLLQLVRRPRGGQRLPHARQRGSGT